MSGARSDVRMANPSPREQVRSETEELLRQSEERFRNLTLAAFEDIGISEGGKILDVNDQLARMLGYSREELIGKDVLSTITFLRHMFAIHVQAIFIGPIGALLLKTDPMVKTGLRIVTLSAHMPF